MFGQSAGQYYYGNCVHFEGDAADVEQPVADSPYGQSVILNVKTRQLFVKVCTASSEARRANIDLSRFGIKKTATKTVISGQPDDENNYEQQPIAPRTEQVKAQRRFTLDIAPYSMVMLEYKL